jgi:hypothetical protein
MNEAEWLACEEPGPMLTFLGKKASERKIRLFACACVWRQWLLAPLSDQLAVDVAERFADGQATDKELKAARSQCKNSPECSGGAAAYKCATPAVTKAAAFASYWARSSLAKHRGPDHYATVKLDEYAAHARLLRCIFGNPFKPITFNPSWLTPTVKTFAEQIYNDRAFDRIPVLGDALEEHNLGPPRTAIIAG